MASNSKLRVTQHVRCHKRETYIIYGKYGFYIFVLCSGLQPASSSICPCSSLHYSVRCIPTACDIFTIQTCWATTSPSYCFVLDYPFINEILSFLLPTLLMRLFPRVLLSHRLEFLLSQSVSVQLHWLLHSPPSWRLAITLLVDTTLLRLFTAHTLPYINTTLGLQACFWIFEPWGWEW